MGLSTISPQIWTQTYTSFGGCDIVALIEDAVIGNLQGISYSVTREKAPIYTMGRADPVSFSRGKRGIAGSMVFTNFDREALFDVMGKKYGVNLQYYKKNFDLPAGGKTIELEDSVANGNFSSPTTANYADQIPPFNVTITAANEYGQAMMMGLFGVELLNQGQGVSVDDMVTETQFTFIARAIVGWKPQDRNSGKKDAYSNSIESQLRQTEAFKAAESFSNLA